MAFVFFFSYARANRRNCERASPVTGATTNLLDQLFDDLVAAVHDDLGGDRREIGYRDIEELTIGTPWPQRLAEAVCHARVLVTVFTPGYFESVNCGREFRVFQDRITHHGARVDPNIPAPIVPVFWTNENACRRGLADPIQHYFRDIQYRQVEVPNRYQNSDCKQLMDLYGQEYRRLIYSFAQAICELAAHDLDALRPSLSFHELPSAFEPDLSVVRSEPDLSLDKAAAMPAEVASRRPLPVLRPSV